MPTMNVSLPDDLVEFVKTELADGGYGNQSDVVRDGLRVLRERRNKRRVLMQLLHEGHVVACEGTTKVPQRHVTSRHREARREAGCAPV